MHWGAGTGNGWTRGHIAPHQAQNIRNHSALSQLFLHSQLVISRMGERVAQDISSAALSKLGYWVVEGGQRRWSHEKSAL